MNWTKQRLVRFYEGWSRSQRFANLVGNYSSSVAVSISKRSCELTINRSTNYKVLFVSLLISPRDKFPSSCNSPTVLEDLQTVPEWPLFEHLKQVAFFAGKFTRLWVGEFPQCSQRVDEGWLGDFAGGGFLSLSFGALFAFLWPRLPFFFLSLQHLGSRFSKELKRACRFFTASLCRAWLILLVKQNLGSSWSFSDNFWSYRPTTINSRIISSSRVP